MKPATHYLRFNTEVQFEFDSASKLYCIKSSYFTLFMPYVITLRLKRYLKGIANPTPQQLNDWFNNLPREEKYLVKRVVHHPKADEI